MQKYKTNWFKEIHIKETITFLVEANFSPHQAEQNKLSIIIGKFPTCSLITNQLLRTEYLSFKFLPGFFFFPFLPCKSEQHILTAVWG